MSSKVSLRTLFAVVAVVAIALAVWLQGRQVVENRRLKQENYRLREEAAQAKFDLEMARIDTYLKVPTEALYSDYKSRGELHQIRWQTLKDNGAEEEFVPVNVLYDHQPEDRHHYFDEHKGMGQWNNSVDNFWEGYAINHAGRGARRLNGMLKSSEEFRSRLMADVELRDEYLKPLLMRLVRSPEWHSRLAALESMLLLDDQRPELLASIRDDLERLSGSPPRSLLLDRPLGERATKRRIGEYHRLIREHGLEEALRMMPQPEEAEAGTSDPAEQGTGRTATSEKSRFASGNFGQRVIPYGA